MQRLCAEIKPIINAWDPEGLIKLGADDDEYDAEIEAIVGSRYRFFGIHSVAHVVSEVFNFYFETKSYTQRECESVGAKIWDIFSKDKIS